MLILTPLRRAMTGQLSSDQMSRLHDPTGRNLGAAIQYIGGSPRFISSAKKNPEDIFAYLELHVEQGPSLFREKIPIGIVTGIVGIHRGTLSITGQMDHAGTTPMGVRKDALTAASEVILAIETICRLTDEIVGTVGRIDVSPNSLNVIPGTATCHLELRALRPNVAFDAISKIQAAIDDISNRRYVQIQFDIEASSEPVVFKDSMIARIRETCGRLSIPYLEMPSGAGHDASHMARLAPAGMIFIPSREGRSHCPEEWSEYEHIGIGTQLLTELFLSLDQEEEV